jgi:hypothetical protein
VRKKRAICPLIITHQQCLTSPSVPPTTSWPPPGRPSWRHLKGSGGMTQRSQALAPLPSRRFSRGSKVTLTSMQGSSETLSRELEATPHNAPSSPRSKGGPCPRGLCKTLSERIKTSTWSSCMSLSIAWPSPWKGEATLIIYSASFLRSAKRQLQRGCPQSHNGHLQPRQTGTSRIGDKSESRSSAMMGTAAQPDGSDTWTKGGWLGIPIGTPPTTSRSSSTSMPQLILEELMRHPRDSQVGSSLCLWNLPPCSPCSIEDSTCFPRITGDTWQKSTTSTPSMNSVSQHQCKLTNSSMKWRRSVSSCSSPREGWKWGRWPNRSSTCTWGSTGPEGNMNRCVSRLSG